MTDKPTRHIKRLRASADGADKGEGISLKGLPPEQVRGLLAGVVIDRENDRIEGDVGL